MKDGSIAVEGVSPLKKQITKPNKNQITCTS